MAFLLFLVFKKLLILYQTQLFTKELDRLLFDQNEEQNGQARSKTVVKNALSRFDKKTGF